MIVYPYFYNEFQISGLCPRNRGKRISINLDSVRETIWSESAVEKAISAIPLKRSLEERARNLARNRQKTFERYNPSDPEYYPALSAYVRATQYVYHVCSSRVYSRFLSSEVVKLDRFYAALRTPPETLTYFKSMAGYTCNEYDNLYIAHLPSGLWEVVRWQRTNFTAKTLKACKAWIQRSFEEGTL